MSINNFSHKVEVRRQEQWSAQLFGGKTECFTELVPISI